MTEESSTTADFSDAATATDVTHSTGGNAMTSSWSSATEFYFRWAVVIIGVVGTATNGLILYALVASKQHRKHPLILNQNVFDLFTCVFLVVIYSMKISRIYLTGAGGYFRKNCC